MRRKALQDLANTLCHIAVGWRMGEDTDSLAALPNGELHFNVLEGSVQHSATGPISLYIAGELSAWFLHRLESLRIPKSEIESAELIARFDKSLKAGTEKSVLTLDWNLKSRVETNERAYASELSEVHVWQSSRDPGLKKKVPPNITMEADT